MSMWHAFKGGSDTYSKMIWSIMHYTPNESAQAGAVSQMLLFSFINIHRLSHYFSAKDDLSEYTSLDHFRKLASKRATLFANLIKIVIFSTGEKTSAETFTNTQQARAIMTICAALIRKVNWAASFTLGEPSRYIKRVFSKQFSELKQQTKKGSGCVKTLCWYSSVPHQ